MKGDEKGGEIEEREVKGKLVTINGQGERERGSVGRLEIRKQQ